MMDHNEIEIRGGKKEIEIGNTLEICYIGIYRSLLATKPKVL